MNEIGSGSVIEKRRRGFPDWWRQYGLRKPGYIGLSGLPVDVPITVDGYNIEVWNRSARNVLGTLWPEDRRAHGYKDWVNNAYRGGEKIEYWFFPAGEVFTDDYDATSNIISVDSTELPAGVESFFAEEKVVLELGCGGGEAALQLAKWFPGVSITAVDHILGDKLPMPPQDRGVKFVSADWNDLSKIPIIGETNSVDSIYSRQGVGRYFDPKITVQELTRVAKIGAWLRADQNRGVIGQKNFSDLLVESGWDVWILRSPSGEPTDTIVAQLQKK